MPVIRIDYDNEQINEENVQLLSEATRTIVLEETGTDDVMVYANSSQIKVNVHPIEIFVQLSAHKIKNIDELVARIKTRLLEWKHQTGFTLPINFTFIPMDWKIEIGI